MTGDLSPLCSSLVAPVMIYAPSQGQARIRPLVKVIALGAGGDAAATEDLTLLL